VALLDVRLPDSDGVAVCREIHSQMPDVACLMLTAYADDRALRDQSRRAEVMAQLTNRERTILELLGEGLTNRETGERMAEASADCGHT
jgi:DNA-binding NarL/FixJ family response regulator